MLIARLEVLGEVDARGAVRFDVGQSSMVRGEDGRLLNVMVENFSRTGFLFVSKRALPAGTLLAIGLSCAGSREAKVVWCDGERHGCEFLVPLPQSRMERAFAGQGAVLAELEGALRRRLLEPPPEAENAEPRDNVMHLPAQVRGCRLSNALRRLLGSHRVKDRHAARTEIEDACVPAKAGTRDMGSA